MKIRNLVFGIAVSMFLAGASWAQNNPFDPIPGGGFFSFTSNDGRVSFTQSFNDDGSLCQNFVSFGNQNNGNSNTQTITQFMNFGVFGTPPGAPGSAGDPCVP